MGKVIAKIVLTGGPCAGKTTALAKIQEYYQDKGYKVLVVNESATEIINGGIKPFGKSPLDLIKFQEIILQYQKFKEVLYLKTAAEYAANEKIIMVYDRGLLDNKAYINQKIFSKILEKNNIKELEMIDRYDMVIHLVTAADGAQEAYTLGNNTARIETIEEALELDKKTINAWAGHQNLRIIGNEMCFEDKMNKVIENINSFINAPITIRNQKKYLINLKKSDLSFLSNDNSTLINLHQYYLKTNEVETRLRERDYDGTKTYFITVQKKLDNGKSNVITNKNIDEKTFQKFLLNSDDYSEIYKQRCSFTINKQYYQLDIFPNMEYGILEVEPTFDNSIINIPEYLNVVEDVTGKEEYSNKSLAEQNGKILVKKITK